MTEFEACSDQFNSSGRSRPSDKGGGGGGGHPDPGIRGVGPASKIFFLALRASFWSKNKECPGVSPISATEQCSF